MDPAALRLGHLRFVLRRRREGEGGMEEVVMDPEGNVGEQGVREKSEIVVSLTTMAAGKRKNEKKRESAEASGAEETNGEKERGKKEEKEAGGEGVVATVSKQPSRMEL